MSCLRVDWEFLLRSNVSVCGMGCRIAGHTQLSLCEARALTSMRRKPNVAAGGTGTAASAWLAECYDERMYAQKFRVELVIGGERKPCPLEWLDQFCMRNFTNAAEFDDTLPTGEGRVEASFRVTPARFAESLGAWLSQRGKGDGKPVQVHVSQVC